MAKQYDCRCNTSTINFPKNFAKYYGSSTILNPHGLANLHSHIRNIKPEWLDGIYMNVKKQHRMNVASTFTAILSRAVPSGVQIGGIYHSTETDENILESIPTFSFNINPSTFSTNLLMSYQKWSKLRLQEQLQIDAKRNWQSTMSLDFIDKSSTGSLSYFRTNKNVNRTIIAYLQNFTNNLAFGIELAHQWNRSFDDVVSCASIAARYSNNNCSWAATANCQAFNVSYWRHINDRLQMGSTLDYNDKIKKGNGCIYYQYEFEDSRIRGMIDSEQAVGFTLTRRHKKLGCELDFSLMLCIPTNKFAYGFKLNIIS